MPIESVVGHDPSEIRVSDKEDSEKVIHLSLVPVGTIVQTGDGRDRRRFVGVCLDSDARIVAHTQQVVDHFKPLVARWIVDGGNVRHLCKLGCSMVFEKMEDRKDARGWDIDDQLVLPYGELLDVFGQAGKKVLPISVQ